MAPRKNSNTHSAGGGGGVNTGGANAIDMHNILTAIGDHHNNRHHPDQNYDTMANTTTTTTSPNNSITSNGSSGQNNNNNGHSLSSPGSSTAASPLSGNGHHNNTISAHRQQQQQQNCTTATENFSRCCVPIGDCFKANTPPDYGLINLDNLSDCVRVICSNENCTVGQYMHRECFEHWEQGILNTLKTTGRARSWSDRQRAQNLWTRKGYDLIFKHCDCKCKRGYLKKDSDWAPPIINNNNNNNNYGHIDEESSKKKKKRNRNQKPVLTMTTINPGVYHPNSKNHNNNNNNNNNTINNNNNHNTAMMLNNSSSNGTNNHNHNNNNHHQELNRNRTGSLSSFSNGSSTPPVLNMSEHSISPIHINNGNNNNNNNNNINNNNLSPQVKMHQQNGFIQLQNQHQQLSPQTLQQQRKIKVEKHSEHIRATSGCNGIFSRRIDFAAYNSLNPTRVNSYNVKMEDEGNHGNDDTRLFILSSLAQNHRSRVNCVLCDEEMLVFDRYPLVDGTFFLSPKPHSNKCIEVKYEGGIYFLNAVCMECCDREGDRSIYCRFCCERWDGSTLVLGTMYSFDIFAAMPCCDERLKCNSCCKLLVHPGQRLDYYGHYSHVMTCPFCTSHDAHFVKPLTYCYVKKNLNFSPMLL